MDPPWRIELLGVLRAERNGHAVSHFETRKTAALLAYLAYHHDRSHPRELLIEMLWPEEDPEATRPRFRQTLACLRRALEQADHVFGAVLVADRMHVRLAPQAAITDVAEFASLLRPTGQAGDIDEQVRRLERAVSLYHGELRLGYYEEWIFPERERLADSYLDALCRLADLLAVRGDLTRAIDYGRRAVAAGPLREEAHCCLMRLYARAGRGAEALRQYEELRRRFQQELGVRPGPAIDTLAREIQTGAFAAPVPSSGTCPPSAAPLATSALPCAGAPRAACSLEPVGGAMPLMSPFYLERAADSHFRAAIMRRDSIVLVKGPRQAGKTSLLARGLQQARDAGMRVVLTDFQNFAAEQLSSTEALFRSVAERMADELELEVLPEDVWNPRRGWNVNFERYLRREVLGANTAPLVWGLDEVDRLFSRPFASEVFGLFRSWHNARSLNPAAPWAALTLAIAYATEAHLFITDLNQSPFNVGTRLTLEDFTPEQVSDLNRRHGSPLRAPEELARFLDLVGGHPYLVRRGLHDMVLHGLRIDQVEALAGQEENPFSDHLRRLLVSLSQDGALADAIREVLRSGTCSSSESFYRLRSAGVILGETAQAARMRCGLYRLHLERHLR